METETRLALLEQGHKQMASDIKEVKKSIDEIKTLLINNLVTQKDFNEYKTAIRAELEIAKEDYLDRLSQYQRSQFWQKVMTFGGGICLTVLTTIIVYEVSKLLDK